MIRFLRCERDIKVLTSFDIIKSLSSDQEEEVTLSNGVNSIIILRRVNCRMSLSDKISFIIISMNWKAKNRVIWSGEDPDNCARTCRK